MNSKGMGKWERTKIWKMDLEYLRKSLMSRELDLHPALKLPPFLSVISSHTHAEYQNNAGEL
jgi:hypothetical protein